MKVANSIQLNPLRSEAGGSGHHGKVGGWRLGDSVSIALLRILDEQELVDPKTVQTFLPLIRDSFSYPPIIALQVDKKPKVTLFLLKYLDQTFSTRKPEETFGKPFST
jgi:hypothetical protein